jgi:hypothetical protein
VPQHLRQTEQVGGQCKDGGWWQWGPLGQRALAQEAPPRGKARLAATQWLLQHRGSPAALTVSAPVSLTA